MSEVMVLGDRKTNAEAIADIVKLGYIKADDIVLDMTYGQGAWWKDWRPDLTRFQINDRYEAPGTYFDFRELPQQWEGWFNVVAFDPPYKLKGTGGSHESDKLYGVATPYEHWTEMFFLIHDGIDEAVRVCKPGGVIIFKAMDQVSGGQMRWTRGFLNHFERLGCRHAFTLGVRGYRRQPEGRAQRHPRADFSQMHILIRED